MYDLDNLSSADFEDLARDLVGRELGLRFEGFSSGPDGGIDGRHSQGKKSTILQAKHYAGSAFSTLKRRMVRERKSIDQLKPSRYILVTSRALTPHNKSVLADVIGPYLKNQSDIIGPDDIRALLKKHQDVAKAHIKLWLGSTAVLEQILRAASQAFSSITKDEIAERVRIYAQNPSYEQSFAKLEAHHVVIISGPPGVGKTTLADMLSYTYFAKGWELVPIRSLEDGFAAINDKSKQIFLFDDFLGKVALDKHALASKDSDLVRFMRRARKSKNARFILTTRAYIFEEARRSSEHLADKSLDVSKYVLDVGIYTRRIRARILFNHLVVSDLPKAHIRSLIRSDTVLKIIDHKHYNPRVIEWMTTAVHLEGIPPSEYPKAFLLGLESPRRLWDIAFRDHINDSCRHLLIALFFCSEYGTDISELRTSFDALHAALCERYGIARGPKDFEESLRILEGGFVNISAQQISYINPSFRDYMTGYLEDLPLLKACVPAAQSLQWARTLWSYVRGLPVSPAALAQIASELGNCAQPLIAKEQSARIGISNSDSIDLLLEWWSCCQEDHIIALVRSMLTDPKYSYTVWSDAERFVNLATNLRALDEFVSAAWAEEVAVQIEVRLLELLGRWVPPDDLEKISDAVEEAGSYISADVRQAVLEVIRSEFEELPERISDIESESSLSEHITSLRKLGPRAGVPHDMIAEADRMIAARIEGLEAETQEAEAPDVQPATTLGDRFSNKEVRDLFASLLDR